MIRRLRFNEWFKEHKTQDIAKKQEINERFKEAEANGDVAEMNKQRKGYKALEQWSKETIRDKKAQIGKAVGSVVKSGGEKVDVQVDKTDIGANATDISANATDIGANATDIGKTAYRVQVLPSKPVKAVDYFPYMCEIGKRTDLTDIQKVQLLHEAYHDLGDGNRKDITCPIDIKYLKKHGFNKDGYLEYDWPKLLGFKHGSVKSITRASGLIRKWRRVGSLRGNNFSDAPAAKVYTNDDLSLPYIVNSEAIHEGTFRNDDLYFDVINAIAKGDLGELNKLMIKNGSKKVSNNLFKEIVAKYKKFIFNANLQLGALINAKYGLQGSVAEWQDSLTKEVYLKGGAVQFTLPLSGLILKRLGILSE